MMLFSKNFLAWAMVASFVVVTPVRAENALSLKGDVGMAIYKTPTIARSTDKSTTVLPYVYADYGRLYARVDTIGYKLAPMGYGHLELAGRVSFEGYRSSMAGIDQRARPKPFGLGTFQETPYGAWIVYGFKDLVSGGSLIDATYAVEFIWAGINIYPQVGIERRDRKYVDSLYGIQAQEHLLSGLPSYSPGYSASPNLAVAAEYPLTSDYKLTVQFKRRWLDHSIYESPLVDMKSQTSGVVALSKTFR